MQMTLLTESAKNKARYDYTFILITNLMH